MKILLLSRYSSLAASTRLRFLQYVPYIARDGIEVTHEPLLDDEYLKKLYKGDSAGLGFIVSSYLRRISALIKQRRYDLLWIQYELFPWVPHWIENLVHQTGIPYMVDYDDAFFHRYDMHRNPIIRRLLRSKIDRVMQGASTVVAGNEYLAGRSRDAGCKRVQVIPTVVDINRYSSENSKPHRTFTIGWIGSPVTSHYLSGIRHALEEVCRDTGATLVLVGSGQVSLHGVPTEILDWEEENEVRDISTFDAGIMPLNDTPWDRGKCGYKLIQYMACGKPVVASPVGANIGIVDHGTNGFLARDEREWVKALKNLCYDPELRHNMGMSGRRKVESGYCLQVTAPRMLELIHEAADRRKPGGR